MLSNAHFLAKFRFGTAENEPAKILQILLIMLLIPKLPALAADFHRGPEETPPGAPRGARGAPRAEEFVEAEWRESTLRNGRSATFQQSLA